MENKWTEEGITIKLNGYYNSTNQKDTIKADH